MAAYLLAFFILISNISILVKEVFAHTLPDFRNVQAESPDTVSKCFVTFLTLRLLFTSAEPFDYSCWFQKM
jgi:hypothetical protein